MQISQESISRALSGLWEIQDTVYDYASTYGEPGYGDDRTTAVILGDYWHRQGTRLANRANRRDGTVDKLSSWDRTHPRLMAQLEAQGIETQWYDEWVVIDDRAYRTQGDCYGWQPSYLYGDGDPWVPDADDDGDVETVVEEVKDDPSTAINLAQFSAETLERVGFEHCNGRFENGWHPGQTDDPRVILPKWQAQYPTCEFVFIITDIGQFYMSFHLFRRETESEES